MKVRLRLDTMMYYVGDGNGTQLTLHGKTRYFDDIRDAERALAHYKRHNAPFEEEAEVAE